MKMNSYKLVTFWLTSFRTAPLKFIQMAGYLSSLFFFYYGDCLSWKWTGNHSLSGEHYGCLCIQDYYIFKKNCHEHSYTGICIDIHFHF